MQASHIKQHVPAFAYQRSGFLRAMSDAGLKPTVVHHNLTPAELYEQVQSPPTGEHIHQGTGEVLSHGEPER